jgi:hypothetical protein
MYGIHIQCIVQGTIEEPQENIMHTVKLLKLKVKR